MQDTFATPSAPGDTPEALGAQLAHARRAAGLEVRAVAERLRTTQSMVQALERGDFNALGAPIFTRNYLARYADLLGLDRGEFMARYRAVAPERPPELAGFENATLGGRRSSSPWGWLVYPLLVALVGGAGWWGVLQIQTWFTESPTLQDDDGRLALPAFDEEAGQAAATAAAAGGPPAAAAASTGVAAAPDAPQAPPPPGELAFDGDAAESAATLTTAGAGTPAAAAPGAAPATADGTASPGARDGQAQLVLTFVEDCWVEIRDAAGERLVYGVQAANTRSTVAGTPPFSLILGNAPAVTITIDGRAVERSIYVPSQGSVARFTLGDNETPARG